MRLTYPLSTVLVNNNKHSDITSKGVSVLSHFAHDDTYALAIMKGL